MNSKILREQYFSDLTIHYWPWVLSKFYFPISSLDQYTIWNWWIWLMEGKVVFEPFWSNFKAKLDFFELSPWNKVLKSRKSRWKVFEVIGTSLSLTTTTSLSFTFLDLVCTLRINKMMKGWRTLRTQQQLQEQQQFQFPTPLQQDHQIGQGLGNNIQLGHTLFTSTTSTSSSSILDLDTF